MPCTTNVGISVLGRSRKLVSQGVHSDNDAVHPIRLSTWPTLGRGSPKDSVSLKTWIKRDDLSGLGGGSGKQGTQTGMDVCRSAPRRTLVTSGAAQSNHARLTAAAGAKLGLGVVLVLSGEFSPAASGNLALDGLFGAQVIWVSNADQQHAVPT